MRFVGHGYAHHTGIVLKGDAVLQYQRCVVSIKADLKLAVALAFGSSLGQKSKLQLIVIKSNEKDQ